MHYKLWNGTGPIWDGIKCSNIIYYPKHSPWPFSEVLPSGKLGCFAQIYINPIPCTPPALKQSMAKINRNFAMPSANILLSIFDGALDPYDPKTNFKEPKCCVFYIHVEAIRSTWDLKMGNHQRGNFHYVYFLNYYYMLHTLYYSTPTRLSYWIEYSEEKQLFQVSQTAVLGCTDYTSFYKNIENTCEKYVYQDRKYTHCFELTAKQSLMLSDVVQFDKTIKNRKAVERLRTQCINQAVFYTGRSQRDSYPNNLYLGQYIASEVITEPLFLSMLIPNCSVVNTRLMSLYGGLVSSTRNSILPTSVFISSTGFDSVHFITCVSIHQKSYLSLVGYISAFDVITWIFILLTLILSAITWNYVCFKAKEKSIFVIFFLNILLGQSTEKIKKVRLITGAWIIAGVFLSNNYQGSNIDQITSPLVPKKMETFEEILSNNLTIYSLPLRYEDLIADIKFLGYSLLSWRSADSTFGKLYVHRQRDKVDKNELERIIKSPKNKKSLHQLDLLKFDFYVNTLSKCGRDVFVDTLSYVKKLRMKMLSRDVDANQIAQSKVAYGQMNQNWVIKDFETNAETYSARRFGLIQ